MRFLLVDDDPLKINLVRNLLLEHEVRSSDILVAEHAARARVVLASEAIDVMLVDVLLPARAGSKPTGETSIELLRQIVDDGTSRGPRYLVGMTASVETQMAFSEEFRQLVLQVLHVEHAASDWKVALRTFLSFLKSAETARDRHDYDVCVLNALRSPELEAVTEVWPIALEGEKILGRNIAFRSGILTLDGRQRRIACGHLSQMGPVASAHAAECMLRAFRPRVILMTGICGGFAGQAEIGDVVVAEKSWDWQAGKWTKGGTLLTAPEQKEGTAELVALTRGIDTKLGGFHSAFEGKKPEKVPGLVVGPMVTGSSVVASLDIQKAFRQQHRKMVAVDMECYGLYYSCANNAGAPAKVICIKAVSDLADRGKKDDFQRYCSYLSAQVALELLSRYFDSSEGC